MSSFTISHYSKTERFATACKCSGCGVWMICEPCYNDGESQTAGQNRTPASTDSQHLHNDFYEKQQERWMLSRRFLLHVHFWPSGHMKEVNTNKGILVLSLPSPLSLFWQQLLEISCATLSVWNVDVVPRGTALPPAHRSPVLFKP